MNARINGSDEAVFHDACDGDGTSLPPAQMYLKRSWRCTGRQVGVRQRRFGGDELVECLAIGGSVIGRRSNHDEIANRQ